MEIEGIDKIEQVSQKLMGNGSLIEKIFNHLTANDQCEKYLRFLLKNPLISIIKTRSNLEINPSKYL